MPILRQIYYMIGFTIILSGCSQSYMQKTAAISTKQVPIVKKEIEIITKKPKIEKNEIKIVTKKPKIKKLKYKYCNKHKKIMIYASKYIEKEFYEGYFLKKDIIGAKAQLFLIKNKSLTPFAKNINEAEDSYTLQYKLAKKNKCNLNKFKLSPISKVRNSIKILEKNHKNIKGKK